MNNLEENKIECIVKNEKGITLIALAIMIFVMGIILSITLSVGTEQLNLNQDTILEIELEMVFNAALQTYTTNSLTGEAYPGRTPTSEEIVELEVVMGATIADEEKLDYYVVEPGVDSEKLGFENSSDNYIINYKKGMVYNLSTNETSSGDVLYRSN